MKYCLGFELFIWLIPSPAWPASSYIQKATEKTRRGTSRSDPDFAAATFYENKYRLFPIESKHFLHEEHFVDNRKFRLTQIIVKIFIRELHPSYCIQ